MVKRFFSKVAEILGVKRSTKYVNQYLHRANIRSAVFMSAVVILLEIWLVIRQHNKYIIPAVQGGAGYLETLFNNTSLFWLLMIMGAAMLVYSIFFLSERKSRAGMITVLAIAGVGIVLCSLLPLENRIKNFNPKRITDTVLLIALYSSIFLFHISVIVAAIFLRKGKKIDWLTSVLVISLFALCLLIFGVKVSYSDFFSSSDIKQIICFLTMIIYVACLLIWRPYISIGLLGIIFFGFYFLLAHNPIEGTFIIDPETGLRTTRVWADGDKINYITFFISLALVSMSIFNQRHHEALKDEELELLATKDKLSGLYAFEYFTSLCARQIKNDEIKPGEYIYLFLDITDFKIFNDQRGFENGNVFLRRVGEIISEIFPNSLVSRQADDHYVVFTKNDDIEERLKEVEKEVKELDIDIRPGVKVGGYLFTDADEDIHNSIERARYACAVLKKKHRGHGYMQFDEKMHEKYTLVQYIVSRIDEAVQEGWIVAYYQPVVYSQDRKLCGVEALARWIDPKYGFLNPGVFIGALEDAQLAYKVDLAMLELVCRNMRRVLDEGKTIVPTSINFSRADFSIVDVPNEIVKITNKYQIPTHFLHIEITESALLDEHVDLQDAIRRIKDNGFSIWLDDFGSGYSSFNTLKNFNFDVLKLDMEFLKGFETNEKSKPLIKAVIDMANQIGMRTLAEGVETETQAAFLKSIGCEKLQGYLTSKPIPVDELNRLIGEGKLVIASKLD